MIFWVVLIVILDPTAANRRMNPVGFMGKVNMSCMRPIKMFAMLVMRSDESITWVLRNAMIVTVRAQTMHWDKHGWIKTARNSMEMKPQIPARIAMR